MDCCMQASLSFTISWSSLKLMFIKLVMPFKHLILWHLLLLPSIFPSIRVFSNQSALCIRWPRCIYVDGSKVSASKSGCLRWNSFSSSAGGRDLPCWQLTPSGPMDSNLPASHLSNWSLSHLRKQGSILVWSRTKKLVSLSPPFLWPMSNQSARRGQLYFQNLPILPSYLPPTGLTPGLRAPLSLAQIPATAS